MELTGEQEITAPKEQVWSALNDPEVLQRSIPGCQSFIREAENQFLAKIGVKVGPVNLAVTAKVRLADIVPPDSYTIIGEGNSGMAGFAKGEARVTLTANGTNTKLGYTAQAKVGGKLAQMGGRILDATAKKLSSAFFAAFAKEIEQQKVKTSNS